MKLSKAQSKVLKELSEEGIVLHFMEGLNPYWFISGSMKTIRYDTVELLLKAGVIEEFNTTKWNRTQARITDKGREYLN
jgi:hypothetical protein